MIPRRARSDALYLDPTESGGMRAHSKGFARFAGRLDAVRRRARSDAPYLDPTESGGMRTHSKGFARFAGRLDAVRRRARSDAPYPRVRGKGDGGSSKMWLG